MVPERDRLDRAGDAAAAAGVVTIGLGWVTEGGHLELSVRGFL